MTFRAGFVALAGRPNVGKSTLLNALLKTRLSIVSPKPQTTRHRILGILNGEDYQACFVDTPGLLDQAQDLLQGTLIRATRRALREDADLALVLVEPAPPPEQELDRLAAILPRDKPVLLAVNKADLAPSPEAARRVADAYAARLSPAAAFVVSALKGRGLEELLAAVVERLPESPPYYDRRHLSDRWERFFAAEFVRQAIFEQYQQEIPHACAVEIEEFKEARGQPDRVRAVIHVERATQKGILLGRSGRSIKALRAASEKALKDFLQRPVRLELWVKVTSNWRKDPAALKALGYE